MLLVHQFPQSLMTEHELACFNVHEFPSNLLILIWILLITTLYVPSDFYYHEVKVQPAGETV